MKSAGFRPAAQADVDAAYKWYEEQRPGLGREFIAAVDAAVGSILAFPESYPVVHRGDACPSRGSHTVSSTASRGSEFSSWPACTALAIRSDGGRGLMANQVMGLEGNVN